MANNINRLIKLNFCDVVHYYTVIRFSVTMSKGLESDCIMNHHLSSCHRLYVPLLFFLSRYNVFSYIFLTLMNSILLTQISPSFFFFFQVFGLHISGKFKHQGNFCHFIFAILLIKHSFHIMFRLWIWGGMLTPRQLFSHLTSTCTSHSQMQFFIPTEFRWIFTAHKAIFMSLIWVSFCVLIKLAFQIPLKSNITTEHTYPLHFVEAHNKELTVCIFLPWCSVCNRK